MCGGFLKTTSRFALVAATGLFLSQIGEAQAADLGGDCCADLEERVAELESTTVRKRTRGLSMTISGRVNYGLQYWSDGGSSQNAALNDDFRDDGLEVVHGPGGSSRVSIDGRGQITSDVEALYRFRFKLVEFATKDSNQGGRDEVTSSIDADEIYWGLRSRTLGAVTVGRRAEAHQSAAKVDISGKTGFAGNIDPLTYARGVKLRERDNNLQAITLGDAFATSDGDNGATEANSIRYDSPTFAGFVLSASWSNRDGAGQVDQDIWAVRLSYANQFGDVRVAGAIAGFWEDNIESTSGPEDSGLLGSLGLMHVPTGLFINGGGGFQDQDLAGNDDQEFFYVTAGIQQKWFGIGRTTIWGTYYWSDGNDIITTTLDGCAAATADCTDFESDYWGLGLSQSIDVVNMDLYIGYRNYDTDLISDGNEKVEDIDVIIAGGVINF